MKGANAVAAWMMRMGSCPTASVYTLRALHGRPVQRSLKPEPDPERETLQFSEGWGWEDNTEGSLHLTELDPLGLEIRNVQELL